MVWQSERVPPTASPAVGARSTPAEFGSGDSTDSFSAAAAASHCSPEIAFIFLDEVMPCTNRRWSTQWPPHCHAHCHTIAGSGIDFTVTSLLLQQPCITATEEQKPRLVLHTDLTSDPQEDMTSFSHRASYVPKVARLWCCGPHSIRMTPPRQITAK